MLKLICLNFIDFYQRFVSPLKPKSCRYYPSCSSYAFLQFQKNNIFLAFLYSFFRILKCNPFFTGGVDHPLIAKKLNFHNTCFKPFFLSKKKIAFLYIPYTKNKFYLIKTLKGKI